MADFLQQTGTCPITFLLKKYINCEGEINLLKTKGGEEDMGYGYDGGSGYGGGYGGSSFVLIVVLFILLIIVLSTF